MSPEIKKQVILLTEPSHPESKRHRKSIKQVILLTTPPPKAENITGNKKIIISGERPAQNLSGRPKI